MSETEIVKNDNNKYWIHSQLAIYLIYKLSPQYILDITQLITNNLINKHNDEINLLQKYCGKKNKNPSNKKNVIKKNL